MKYRVDYKKPLGLGYHLVFIETKVGFFKKRWSGAPYTMGRTKDGNWYWDDREQCDEPLTKALELDYKNYMEDMANVEQIYR